MSKQGKRRFADGGPLGLVVALMLAGCLAGAEPLDLSDRQPRTIVVEFEVSPRDKPAQTDRLYTREIPARLEAGERAGELRVVIPAHVVEQILLRQESPVPGSFSDFVWVFDSESGHVQSATLHGQVERELDWGFMTSRSSAQIAVDMSTQRVAGFRRPTTLLGQVFFRHCADAASRRCTLVETSPLDSRTGYVNAVGGMRVTSAGMELKGFSPLGEARFSEVDSPFLAQASESSLPLELDALSPSGEFSPQRDGERVLVGTIAEAHQSSVREVN